MTLSQQCSELSSSLGGKEAALYLNVLGNQVSLIMKHLMAFGGCHRRISKGVMIGIAFLKGPLGCMCRLSWEDNRGNWRTSEEISGKS